jgi:hypothetical protein
LVITSSAFSDPATATPTYPVTIQEQAANGTPTTVGETVNLTSSSTGTHAFALTAGGAAVTTATIPGGSSSVTVYYADEKAGTPTITAAATGLTSGTQQETITAGAPSTLIFTTKAVSGSASNTPTVGPITVQEQDAYGNVSNSALTVSLTSSSTGTHEFAASSGGTAITSINIAAGSSTATFYYGDESAGTPTITAAATGLTSGTQQETIKGGTATQWVITSTAFSAPVSNSATNAFTVTLEDAYGNATTFGTNTTVNLVSTSGTGRFAAFSGGASVTNVALRAGNSSVTAYYGDTTIGTPTITASGGTGVSAATQQETITAAPPAKLVFITGTVSGTASNSATMGAITVEEQDAFGNVTTAAETVNLTSNSAGIHEFAATSGGTAITSINIAAGSSTATFYYGDEKSGTPTITAAATGLTSGTQQETITGGTATQLAITSTASRGERTPRPRTHSR